MNNELKDLKEWLGRNEEHFAEGRYTSEDISNLAIACGFNRSAIAQWLTQKNSKKVA